MKMIIILTQRLRYFLTGIDKMVITLLPMEMSKEIIRNVANVKQHSAMNPFLWVLGIMILPFTGGAYFFRNTDVMWFFLIIMTLIILCTLSIGIYFAIKSPDKLRSEFYQAHHDLLKFCEKTQTSPEQTVSILSINAVSELIETGEEK